MPHNVSRLILPCGTVHVGKVIAGNRQTSGKKRIVLIFEIAAPVAERSRSHG